MENNFDYKNCTVNNLKSRWKEFIMREFYGCIYTNNVECVKYLLDNCKWLIGVLQKSWIADMQFYDFDEQKYKPYFPSEELLKLLKDYTDINVSITKSISTIDDNASYISSTMQNENAVKWEYDGQELTLRKLAYEEKKPESYIKYIESMGDAGIIQNNDLQLYDKHLSRLGRMGNSWFVSYLYHFYDSSHKNWELTLNGFRTGYFKETKEAHKQFLEKISNANEAALGRNQIGLSGADIRRMAKELLANWDAVSQNQEYKNL